MNATVTQPSRATIDPTESRHRLQVLISVALRNSVAALDGFTRRLGSALTEASLRAQGDEAAGLQQAAEHLSRERTSFQRLFSDCLQQGLEQEARTLLARPKSRLRRDALDLSLDSFEAMQRKVKTDNLAQAFDRAHADLLAVLHEGLARWLGLEAAGLRNPFRAEVFLQATVAAWERFEAHEAAQGVLLQQLSPDAFLPLDGILSAVRRELEGRRVLPDAAERKRAPEPPKGLAVSALLEAERRVLAQAGGAFDAALAHLAHARTLPPHTLAILTCLQPPLRALAQVDGRFLLNPRHPGRRLVQLAIQASLASGTQTRSAAVLQTLADRLAEQLARDRSPSTLESACTQLDAQLTPLLQTVAQKRDECIAEAVRQEREARSEQMARAEVMARLEDGTVPAFVESFLLEHWVRVLAYAQNVHATKPALLPNLVQTMDDLIWSVQPKPGAQERKELQARLPGLLNLLNAWLNVVKWDGPPRKDFLDHLAQRHAELSRDASEPNARDLLEQRMDAAQRASEHGMRKLVHEHEEEALIPYMHRIDALVPGDWAEFVRNDGSTVQCRLAWISAARSRFVFVAPSVEMAFVIAEDLFAQSLRAGRARITATGEVLQAALSVASAELAAQTG